MKYWLDKSGYGNADTSGGIDMFWLNGKLQISPEQQIDFLRRLRGNRLPFSKKSVDIVKEIMIVKDTLNLVIRAKTGWGMQGRENIGWYVGYIETPGNVYYFANCIQSSNPNTDFAKARIEITASILDALKIINGRID